MVPIFFKVTSPISSLMKLQTQRVLIVDGVEYPHRGCGRFRADAIARQNQHVHECLQILSKNSVMRNKFTKQTAIRHSKSVDAAAHRHAIQESRAWHKAHTGARFRVRSFPLLGSWCRDICL